MILQNPYRGLFPYSAEDEDIFFGREKEAKDLIEMIVNNQLVVLYGESGTGKTSLINAKIFPELKRRYYYPIYIRLNFTAEFDPLEQVRNKIYNALKELDGSAPNFTPNFTLVEYAAVTSIFGGLIKPILFFDQFEELFTLAPKHITQSAITNFINQLSDFIELRLPYKQRKKKLADTDGHAVADEETFNQNILRFTVVLSLRQDFIAHLDDLKYKIPSIITNRYRIKKFSTEQALDAVLNIARNFIEKNNLGNVRLIESEAAETIITELGTPSFAIDFIRSKGDEKFSSNNRQRSYDNRVLDPTILSLYCNQLYEVAKKRSTDVRKRLSSKIIYRKTPDLPVQITKEMVGQYKPYDIVKSYYNKKLKTQRKLQRAIEKYLITEDGRRRLILLKEFLQLASLNEGVVEKVVRESALLRLFGEGQNREIEIVHDQIAKYALTSRKIREANQVKLVGGAIAIGITVLSILVTLKYVDSKTNLSSLNNTIHILEEKNSRLNDSLTIKNQQIEFVRRGFKKY